MDHDPCALAAEMDKELRTDILPFWARSVDRQNGGFCGQIENNGTFNAQADKGLVMHARHLWTYSAASRVLGDSSCREVADHAFLFLRDHLWDSEHGGFHWVCDSLGAPRRGPKVIYGQAFAIYGMTEYARAGGPPRALELAMETFRLLEKTVRDPDKGGYFEAASPDWSGSVVSALGENDDACAKSMNTNLHVLEALTTLNQATGDSSVRDALRSLLCILMDRVLQRDNHLGLYFNADWSRRDGAVSYGHDIESSWLLTEAAESIGEKALLDEVRARSLAIAAAAARTLDENDGSLPNELRDGRLDSDRIWWVQAESVVGMVNAWQLSADPAYVARAWRVWEYITTRLMDRAHGEWLWGARHPEGVPLEGQYKGGLWKASYHNGRACMEVMRRTA